MNASGDEDEEGFGAAVVCKACAAKPSKQQSRPSQSAQGNLKATILCPAMALKNLLTMTFYIHPNLLICIHVLLLQQPSLQVFLSGLEVVVEAR